MFNMVSRILEDYLRLASSAKAWDLLKEITTLSRIQGSSGLIDAVKLLRNHVEDSGFDVKVIEVDPEVKKGFIETPVSWDLVEAEVEFKQDDKVLARFSSKDHPTLVAAHAPSGEGCGELTICTKDICSGEAVLAEGSAYDLYLNVDAKLIVQYDENRYPDAFPYFGLFIRRNEVKNGKTHVTIPYRLASRIINTILRGKGKVTVCWDVKTRYVDRKIPSLIAWRGSDGGVAFISHICHPKPGAHDNASGSVANYIALDVLSKAPKEASFSSIHIWVPEYTGTVFLREHLPWIPKAVINLDMVGSKQNITGASVSTIAPPRFIQSEITPLVWFSLQKVYQSTRINYSPYGIGSDHDVFVTWGYDAVMVNEWPSKFYHTEMDDVDSIDPSSIVKTSVASLLASYTLINGKAKEDVIEVFESYVKNWYRLEALKRDYSLTYISKYLLKVPIVKEPFDKPPVETPIFGREIYRILGRERFMELMKIPNASTYLEVYAPIAEFLGFRNSVKHFQAELLVKWDRVSEVKVKDAWVFIKSSIGL